MIHRNQTARGFSLYTFIDADGEQCSLQKSSTATEDMIRLGCKEIGLKELIPGEGWRCVDLNDLLGGHQHIGNNRMHLTRSQVAELLPILQRFVDSGEI